MVNVIEEIRNADKKKNVGTAIFVRTNRGRRRVSSGQVVCMATINNVINVFT